MSGETMNPPTVDMCKLLAKKLRARGVIILALDEYSTVAASYGITRSECQQMGRLLDDIIEQLNDGRLQCW